MKGEKCGFYVEDREFANWRECIILWLDFSISAPRICDHDWLLFAIRMSPFYFPDVS